MGPIIARKFQSCLDALDQLSEDSNPGSADNDDMSECYSYRVD